MINKPTPQQETLIADAIFKGKKIEAIRLYREATQVGLADAKHSVEQLAAILKIEKPHHFHKSNEENNNSGFIFALAAIVIAILVFFNQADIQLWWQQFSQSPIIISEPGSPANKPSPAPNNDQQQSLAKPQTSRKFLVKQKTHSDNEWVPLPPYENQYSVDAPDIKKWYAEKLKNPDYVNWKSQSGLPTVYQDFAEEHYIKAARALLAKNIKPPGNTKPYPIPFISRLPRIEGYLDAKEWQDALQISLGEEQDAVSLYFFSDGIRLYIGVDAPQEKTSNGFDQFRFYYHIGLSPEIRNERIHVGRTNRPLGGIRQTTVRWQGAPPESKNERWKKYPISDWQIYKLAWGGTQFNEHRQYEAVLDLAETGLHVGTPFAAFVVIETDPLRTEQGKFKQRQYLGKLGSQNVPIWFNIENNSPQ